MSTLPSCMDRFTNRYIMPQPAQHQNHQYYQQQDAQNMTNGPNGGPPFQQQQTQHNYIMNCYQNTNGWTGVPLISTASRRARKHHNNHNNNNSNHGTNKHQQQQQQHHHHQQHPNNNNNNTHHRGYVPITNDFDETAMSRLAIHAHGAPLILAGRYRNKHHQQQPHQNHQLINSNSGHHKRDQSKPSASSSAGGYNYHTDDLSSSDSHNHRQHHSINNNNNNYNNHFLNNNGNKIKMSNHLSSTGTAITTTSAVTVTTTLTTPDTFSVNSDESSNSSIGANVETCLPRIIKPRKRRKKDRKPITTTATTVPLQPLGHPNNNSMICGENMNIYRTTNVFSVQQCIEISEEPKLQHTFNEVQEIIESNNAPFSNANTSPLTSSACSCRLCDPFCRIWAFPLRRSCSDNTDVEARQISKNVGVIGSNRMSTVRNEWRSSPHLTDHRSLDANTVPSRKGSFSDSGDSGCELLGGLSFSDDLLSPPILTSNCIPPTSPTDTQFDFNFSSIAGEASVFNTTSINELSRKIMDSMDLSSCSSSDSSRSSAFSDSVFNCDDYLLNFDATNPLIPCDLFSVSIDLHANQQHNFDFLFDPHQKQHQQPNNRQSKISSVNNSVFCDVMTPKSSSFIGYDKDRSDEVINCFDMVWSGTKLLPVKE